MSGVSDDCSRRGISELYYNSDACHNAIERWVKFRNVDNANIVMG